MARPKKDTGVPDACQRITDAFWELLEVNQLNEITVGTLATKAGVNRGTFYYHFDDINDMIDKIIKKEMFENHFIPETIFNMVTGVEPDYIEKLEEFLDGYFIKITLLLDKGGSSLVSSKIKAVIVEMWTAILLTTEDEMKLSTRTMIEHASSGMISIIAYAAQQDDPKTVMIESQAFRGALSNFMLTQIAREEGLTKDEVLSRILMVGRFAKVSQK